MRTKNGEGLQQDELMNMKNTEQREGKEKCGFKNHAGKEWRGR